MGISGNSLRTRGYTKAQIEKIGHTIIFLVNGMQPLYKTKLLKLTYLLDEFSVAKLGLPFWASNIKYGRPDLSPAIFTKN